MVFHIDLEDDFEKELRKAAERSGETLDQVATRILRQALSPNPPTLEPFRIEPFALDIPEKWRSLTPAQIDHELEIEHYEETLERSRHEPAALRV